MRGAAIAIGAFIVLTASAAHAQVTLQNDGFTDGAQVGFQAGFAAGEVGASRFVAPEAGRRLNTVQLLYGGAAGTRTVTLRVWDDTAGTAAPGAELFSGDFDVTASNEAIQEFDLTANNVIVTAQFRVGIEFQNGGLPSIARDDDDTITASRNYIKIDSGMWFTSQALGLTGDWIIRAVIEDAASPVPDAAPGGDASGPGTPDAAPGPGADCDGNSDCPVGEYCDTANGACTFDCREDSDCGDNTCNSLGQCVEGGGGGGCCSTDGGGSAGQAAVLLALGVLVLGFRRRA